MTATTERSQWLSLTHNRDLTSEEVSTQAKDALSIHPVALSEALLSFVFVQGCSPGPLRMLPTHPCSHVNP